MILPEFKIINTNTGEEIKAEAILDIDYVSQTVRYTSIKENRKNKIVSHVSFTDETLDLEDARFIYTKPIVDAQEDISEDVEKRLNEIKRAIYYLQKDKFSSKEDIDTIKGAIDVLETLIWYIKNNLYDE